MDLPTTPAAFRRSLSALALSAFVVALSASEAGAGDYHQGGTLDCAECHVLHPQAVASPTVGARAGVGALLKRDVNDLCLSCHDNSPRAADVMGQNVGRFPSDVRQAGYLNRLGVMGQPGTGHTLGSLDTAPGSNPSWSAANEPRTSPGLDCTHCHAPHGSRDGVSAYRNLREDAGNNRQGQGLVTYNAGMPGANDVSRDVFVRSALRYDESNVDFNEPDREDSAMARFCAGCHGEFHGRPGDAATIGGTRGPNGRYRAFVRHPAAGVNLGVRTEVDGGSSLALYNQHRNKVKVMSSGGLWNPAGADATPTCITCHKAHGNGNAFGLILRSGKGRITEDGDSAGTQLENLCGQCHTEASSFASY